MALEGLAVTGQGVAERGQRRDLADAALRLFVKRGYESTTLDELVDAVEVSKRTFFRYFDSKEAVALAAEAELWDAYVDTLGRVAALDGGIVAALRDALVQTTRDLPDGWTERLLRTRGLIGRTPDLRAGSMLLAAAPRTGLPRHSRPG